jgi:hypothetical protein
MSDIDPDILTNEQLLDAALAAAREDTTGEAEPRWKLIRALHHRWGRSVYDRAAVWCSSAHVVERVLGAQVLAQLGTGSGAGTNLYAGESAPLLLALLDDPEEGVVISALCALAHLHAGDPLAISGLRVHASADVRHAVAFALGGRSDAVSMETLMSLARDEDSDVRDWATFGFGALGRIDTPEVREALFARVSDEDEEVRGEALMGLAMRGDLRAADGLIVALRAGSTHYLFLEAAEEMIEQHPDQAELRDLLKARRAGD